jgi:P-type Cu2+ transporter
MVDTIKCDHCGAEANAKYVVKKEFNGETKNFCCRGCLQVYEMLHEEAALQPPRSDDANKNKSGH